MSGLIMLVQVNTG